jgi:hypothetical protein
MNNIYYFLKGLIKIPLIFILLVPLLLIGAIIGVGSNKVYNTKTVDWLINW